MLSRNYPSPDFLSTRDDNKKAPTFVKALVLKPERLTRYRGDRRYLYIYLTHTPRQPYTPPRSVYQPYTGLCKASLSPFVLSLLTVGSQAYPTFASRGFDPEK